MLPGCVSSLACTACRQLCRCFALHVWVNTNTTINGPLRAQHILSALSQDTAYFKKFFPGHMLLHDELQWELPDF
jgi:hypothetical protein